MHICAVVPSYLPHFGGAEVGIHEIFKYLTQTTQHRFTVITATLDDKLPVFEEIDGVHVYRYQRIKRWVKWYAPILQAILPVSNLLNRIQPDVIVLTYVLPVGIAACIASRFLNIPVIMALGGNDIYDPNLTPDRFLQSVSGYFIRRSSRLLAWSNWVKDLLARKHCISSNKITVIPFSVDIDRFHPGVDGQFIRARYNIPHSTTLLFALQRLDIRKRVDILIRAFKEALSQCENFNMKLLIGGKGQDSEKLAALVQELSLEEHVIFAGFISEVEKPMYYAACDIFVLHSYHEGLGIVLEEAAAVAKPQISTYAGGTTDVIATNETGLLVQPGSIIELADAICSLVKQPELRQTMGNKALEHVHEKFAIEIVAKQYLEVFEAILT